jgi:hypothetical protein
MMMVPMPMYMAPVLPGALCGHAADRSGSWCYASVGRPAWAHAMMPPSSDTAS